jgi:hypothetical protein
MIHNTLYAIHNAGYKILSSVAQFKIGTSGELGLPRVSANDSTLQVVFNTLFTIAGALSVVFMIWGGISYALSTGNPEKARQALQTLIYSAVGLIISISAVVIITFVIGRFS